jgi:hypothetical protein
MLAGYAKNDGNAARLKGNERVRARIEEILAVGAPSVVRHDLF